MRLKVTLERFQCVSIVFADKTQAISTPILFAVSRRFQARNDTVHQYQGNDKDQHRRDERKFGSKPGVYRVRNYEVLLTKT